MILPIKSWYQNGCNWGDNFMFFVHNVHHCQSFEQSRNIISQHAFWIKACSQLIHSETLHKCCKLVYVCLQFFQIFLECCTIFKISGACEFGSQNASPHKIDTETKRIIDIYNNSEHDRQWFWIVEIEF